MWHLHLSRDVCPFCTFDLQSCGSSKLSNVWDASLLRIPHRNPGWRISWTRLLYLGRHGCLSFGSLWLQRSQPISTLIMVSASIAKKIRNFGLGFRMTQARPECFLTISLYMRRVLGDLPSILELHWRWEDGGRAGPKPWSTETGMFH